MPFRRAFPRLAGPSIGAAIHFYDPSLEPPNVCGAAIVNHGNYFSVHPARVTCRACLAWMRRGAGNASVPEAAVAFAGGVA